MPIESLTHSRLCSFHFDRITFLALYDKQNFTTFKIETQSLKFDFRRCVHSNLWCCATAASISAIHFNFSISIISCNSFPSVVNYNFFFGHVLCLDQSYILSKRGSGFCQPYLNLLFPKMG